MMDKTGHGISHIKRVENIAKKIASEEKYKIKNGKLYRRVYTCMILLMIKLLKIWI